MLFKVMVSEGPQILEISWRLTRISLEVLNATKEELLVQQGWKVVKLYACMHLLGEQQLAPQTRAKRSSPGNTPLLATKYMNYNQLNDHRVERICRAEEVLLNDVCIAI